MVTPQTSGTKMHTLSPDPAALDLAALEPFSSIGKEVPALDHYREAELLREAGAGCLTQRRDDALH